MKLNDSFPYVSDPHMGTESHGHVYLKNVAVHWLRQRGFDIENIELEHRIERRRPGQGKAAFTDVYAKRDGVEAYVECETRTPRTPHDLSMGGKLPAKRGEAVYVVTDDTIYRVRYRTRVYEPDNSVISDSGPVERKTIEFEPLTAPPLLPV